MPVPQITITPAGFAALVNDEHTGTKVAKVTHIGLTALHFDVNAVGSVLPGEHKRLTTFGGKAVAADTLHLNIRDDGPDTYTLRAFGLYLQDGTLFAVYSQAAPIMEKAAAATLLLATDIRFSKITATSIEVGDVDFINPPATTAQVGVVRLATDQEADAGSDPTTAITPRGLFRYINARFGADAPSTFVKSLLGAATAAIFRTNLGIKSAALRDEGHGNGLNADQLDGEHGAYYLDFRNSTNLPTSWSPSYHTHSITQVDGLVAALQEKANLSGASFVGDVSASKITARGNHFYGGQTYAVLNPSAAGGVCMLRPDGVASTVGELVVATSAITWNGQGLWHGGNFNPSTKANLTGATFTGGVTIQNQALRVQGWSGSATDGVVYFGTGESFIFKSGDAFSFKNEQGGWSAQLNAGGYIWTSSNFDPSSKVNKAGDTMTGHLTIESPSGAASFITRSKSGMTVIVGSNDALGNGFIGTTTNHNLGVYANNAKIAEWLVGGGLNMQGVFRSAGPAAGFFQQSRNQSSQVWANYAFNNSWYIEIEGGAALLALSSTGALSTVGGFDWGSSRKLKDIDGPMPYGLAEVRRISTLIGRYKSEYNNDGRTRLFFDAEQFADVMPEAVDLEGVAFQGERVPSMKLDQVLPPAYRAIAQLADLIDQLRAEIKTLKEGI